MEVALQLPHISPILAKTPILESASSQLEVEVTITVMKSSLVLKAF
jgi:hypothetical protein